MNCSSEKQPQRGVPVIGLLGGPGAGKSHVAAIFQGMGAKVIDADAIARAELDEPAVSEKLVEWWGPGVLNEAGLVDRRAVGKQVFDQPVELARLESLVHPRVNARREELREQYRADPAVTAIIEDCPLLLERALEGDCDTLIFVDASRETRLERVSRTRGWSAEELDRREKNQLPLDTKRSRADYVFNSEADPSTLEAQAHELLVKASTECPE